MFFTKRRVGHARPGRLEIRPFLERLESRIALSGYYDYEVLASRNALTTGQFGGLSPYTAINAKGQVTLITTPNISVADDVLYVANKPGDLTRLTPSGQTNDLGVYAGINDAGQVIVSAGVTTLFDQIRLYDVKNPGDYRVIAQAPQDFSQFLLVAGPTLSKTHFVMPAVQTDPGTHYVVAAGSLAGGAFRVSPALNFPLVYPKVSDTGRVVYKDIVAGSAGSIVLMEPNGGTRVIAGAATGFTYLGAKPDISFDGSVVVFAGNRGFGNGVFVWVEGRPDLVVVAGERDSPRFEPELGQEQGSARFFSVVDTEADLSVTMRPKEVKAGLPPADRLAAFVVSYTATPNAAGPGYTSRGDE